MKYEVLEPEIFDKIFQQFDTNEIIEVITNYFPKKIRLTNSISNTIFVKFSEKNKEFKPLYILTPDDKILKDSTVYSMLKETYSKKRPSISANYLAIPLVYISKCLAIILIIYNKQINKKINLEKYRHIINIFSLIYYNASIYNIAIKDSLTHLYNKRYFNYKTNELSEEAKRNKQKFSIIMIDIDYFKHYNDRYGHQIGDILLKEVSQTILNSSGNASIVARYGGEEFIIFVPQKDKNDAYAIGERIRKSVEDMKVTTDEYFWRLTISVGISSFPSDGNEISNIIKNADTALYESKNRGKNRVSVYNKKL